MALDRNERAILGELARQVNSKLSKAIPAIRKELQRELRQRLFDSPEYNSLLFGQLHMELGVNDASARLEEIINVWIDSTKVELVPVKITGNGLSGGLKIVSLGRDDFQDVIELSSAYISLERGGRFPWLEYLMLEGDKTVYDYYYTLPTPSEIPYSRAGGIMRAKEGSRWKFNSEYKGRKDDNWITRILEGNFQDKLEKIIEGAL